MENAQRLDGIHETQDGAVGQPSGQRLAEGPHPGRVVPTDWFLDPADPDAGRRAQEGTSLEDQATVFLSEYGSVEIIETTVTVLTGATVTALHPGTSTPERTADAQPSVWLGLPGLADPFLDVGGEFAWQVDALCAQTDPEAFFPEKGGSTRDAKKVCSACTVRSECLDYALGNDERFGIWGGLSERERRRLRKRSV